MFVFRKIWRALFFWNPRFEIRPSALLPTIFQNSVQEVLYASHLRTPRVLNLPLTYMRKLAAEVTYASHLCTPRVLNLPLTYMVKLAAEVTYASHLCTPKVLNLSLTYMRKLAAEVMYTSHLCTPRVLNLSLTYMRKLAAAIWRTCCKFLMYTDLISHSMMPFYLFCLVSCWYDIPRKTCLGAIFQIQSPLSLVPCSLYSQTILLRSVNRVPVDFLVTT